MIPDPEFAAMKAWFSSGSTMSESMGLRLIREVEELRAALREIVKEYDEYVGEADTTAIAKARAALGEAVHE